MGNNMQYELWGRKRIGNQYEFIKNFEDVNLKYSEMDKLDYNIYSEAMVLENQLLGEGRLIAYKEFNKPKTLRRKK